MAKLQLDLSGRMGLTPNYFGDSDQTLATNNRNFGSGIAGQMVDGYFNPFLRVGFLSPSISTLGATTVSGATLNANIGSVAYDVNNQDLYLAERGQQLFHFDGLDDTSLVQDFDLGSSGTPVIHDLEVYEINGVRKLFYVYQKSGNFCVGIESLPTGTNDANWLTSTTSGAFTNTTISPYNFMRTSDNGFAYLFQDNNVHKIDGTLTGGTNGTVTPNALSFPAFFRITDAIDYRGFIFIVVHQSTQDITTIQTTGDTFAGPVGIYVWDRATLTSSNNDFITIGGVLSVQKIWVAPNGNLRLLCVGANKLPQIREFDGHAFPIVRELSLGATPQYPDGLTTAGNLTTWLGTDGTLYAFGFPLNSGSSTEVLAKIGSVAVTNSNHPEYSIFTGAIFYGASNSFSGQAGYRLDRQGLTLCYNDGPTGSGTNYIKKFFPFDKGSINSNNQLALEGDIFTPVTPFPTLSTVNTITVFMATGNTTADATVQGTLRIYFNGSSTPWASKSVTRTDINKGYLNIKVGKPYINSMQVKIEYPTNIGLADTIDFHPLFADVDYTQTTVLQAA